MSNRIFYLSFTSNKSWEHIFKTCHSVWFLDVFRHFQAEFRCYLNTGPKKVFWKYSKSKHTNQILNTIQNPNDSATGHTITF